MALTFFFPRLRLVDDDDDDDVPPPPPTIFGIVTVVVLSLGVVRGDGRLSSSEFRMTAAEDFEDGLDFELKIRWSIRGMALTCCLEFR